MTRIVQLFTRYIAAGLIGLAGLLLGKELSIEEQEQVRSFAGPIATALGAAVVFLFDQFVLHRLNLRKEVEQQKTLRTPSLAMLLGAGALLGLSVTGFACASPHAVDARAIKTLTDPILLEYDGYLAADPALAPEDKALRLRSSEILRDTIDRAAASAPAPGSPAPGAAPRH